MNLGKALEALKYDNRMKDWNLSQGLLTEKDVESFDEKLQDLSGDCAPMDLDNQKNSQSKESY